MLSVSGGSERLTSTGGNCRSYLDIILACNNRSSSGRSADVRQNQLQLPQQLQGRLRQLSCEALPDVRYSWTSHEVPRQIGCPRVAAACWVPPQPEILSAALSAGAVMPVGGVAVATEEGDVYSFACPHSGSRAGMLRECMQQIAQAEADAQQRATDAGLPPEQAELAQQTRAALQQQGDLEQRVAAGDEDGAEPKPFLGERCRLLASAQLGHGVEQLHCVEGSQSAILIASGRSSGNSMLSCLPWPHLQSPTTLTMRRGAVLSQPVGVPAAASGQQTCRKLYLAACKFSF